MRAGPIIGTDDTTVTLVTPDDLPPLDPLDPKSARSREVIAAAHAEARKSITARIWAYRGITVPINVFDFTVSRHRDGPEIFLDGFTGKLMKDSFGQALTYLRNQFDPLLVYLDDGLMPIDNNETEQLMKQVAIGRKNWLFIGDIEPGYRAADLLSLVSSAVRNDLDVFVYVKDVLDQLLAGESDYHSLRPDAWKESHPEAVRVYRAEERAARADAKATKRARRRAGRK